MLNITLNILDHIATIYPLNAKLESHTAGTRHDTTDMTPNPVTLYRQGADLSLI